MLISIPVISADWLEILDTLSIGKDKLQPLKSEFLASTMAG